MFDLYFAGFYGKETTDLIIEKDYNQLLSNINERKKIPQFIEAKKNGIWKGKLLIDSGAFSIHKSGKEVPLEDYINWINENHEYLDLYIQLDDIPGKWGIARTKEEVTLSPIKTWENYLYMRSKLIDPNKLLPVFHQGEDLKYLKQMLNWEDDNKNKINYLCISSNKDLCAKKRSEWYKLCFEEIEKSNNPNIKIHSLGTQSQYHCEEYPFTSVDATSWIMTGANGNIYTKWGVITISDRQLYKKENIINNIAFNVFEKYVEEKGFNIEELSNSSTERIKWNLLYLGDWAINQRQYKGPKSFKLGRLF